MKNREQSGAEFAPTVGLADARVWRWRHGQVVPAVRCSPRIADVMRLQRTNRDAVSGYRDAFKAEKEQRDPVRAEEMGAHEARLGEVLRTRLPHDVWQAYADACEALPMGRLPRSTMCRKQTSLRKARRNVIFGR
ncbi:MAG TPA: hypothetical protein VM536_01720 [Chloroflexia bacterium]|nr:hypothetical protein [Chloroflexia bacterium]